MKPRDHWRAGGHQQAAGQKRHTGRDAKDPPIADLGDQEAEINGKPGAKCNQAAGLAGDVPAVLRGLADYLEASSAPTSIRRR